MNVEYFVRNKSYFQTLRNSSHYITTDVLLQEFNKLIQFLNNNIIPQIVSIIGNDSLPIISSVDGSLIRNVGNSNVSVSKVLNSDIENDTIDISKLININRNNVLYFNNNNKLTSIDFNNYSNLLTCNSVGIDVDFLHNDLISDNSIAGSKISFNTLSFEHFDLTNVTALPTSINSIKLKNNSILAANISDLSILESNIEQTLLVGRLPENFQFKRKYITNLDSDLHIIKTYHIADNSINFNHMFGDNKILSSINFNNIQLTTDSSFKLNVYDFFSNTDLLTVDKIKLKSFDFKYWYDGTNQNRLKKTKLSKRLYDHLRKGGLK